MKEIFHGSDLEFLCSQIILFVIGFCKPQSVESIGVTKIGEKFEATV